MPDRALLAKATKQHREALDGAIAEQDKPPTVLQLAELRCAVRDEQAAKSAMAADDDNISRMAAADLDHAAALFDDLRLRSAAAAEVQTRIQAAPPDAEVADNDGEVPEFDVPDEIVIFDDGREVLGCVSDRKDNGDGRGVRYRINFSLDQYAIKPDGTHGESISVLKDVHGSRLALAPSRRSQRRQR